MILAYHASKDGVPVLRKLLHPSQLRQPPGPIVHKPEWKGSQNVDLRPLMPPVFDQGDEGSCVDNAVCGLWGYHELQALKAGHYPPEHFPGNVYVPPSRNFCYWNARNYEGNVMQDAGSTVGTGVSVPANLGLCRETTWPYGPDTLYKKPTDEAYGQAGCHRLRKSPARILAVDIEASLQNGLPVLYGTMVYESFMTRAVAETGQVPTPNSASESFMGGHCMLIVGIEGGNYIVRNSWGTAWALNGYCLIPVEYVESDQLSSDYWTFI